MSYDEKCYDLAEAFLSDTGTSHLNVEMNRDRLAQEIQDVIEAFLVRAEDNYEPPDLPGWEGGFAENH